MAAILPTHGRIVHIRDARRPEEREHAAIISWVNDDGTINVCAFDRNGSPFPLQNVPLVQDGAPVPEGTIHWASWMPYQIGQAAKTEALAGLLAGPGAPASESGPPSVTAEAVRALGMQNAQQVHNAIADQRPEWVDATDTRAAVIGVDVGQGSDMTAVSLAAPALQSIGAPQAGTEAA